MIAKICTLLFAENCAWVVAKICTLLIAKKCTLLFTDYTGRSSLGTLSLQVQY